MLSDTSTVAILVVPVLAAIGIGCLQLRRALARPKLLPEELALAVAWVFIVGSLVWLGIYLSGRNLLGFGAPWTWLAAAHFAFAGFGALTITALCCRVVSDARAVKILRMLLVWHPIAYLVTAAGISGARYCDELGAASYLLIFVIQLVAFALGRPDRIPRGSRFFVAFSLIVPVVTMIPAQAWAWGRPMLDIDGMVRYHGLVNAIGHVVIGLIALTLARPQSHSTVR